MATVSRVALDALRLGWTRFGPPPSSAELRDLAHRAPIRELLDLVESMGATGSLTLAAIEFEINARARERWKRRTTRYEVGWR